MNAASVNPPKPSPAGYRVFHGHYYTTGRFGWWKNIEIIIVAENESQAHSHAVMEYQDTNPSDWSFSEIDTHTAGCTFVTESEP